MPLFFFKLEGPFPFEDGEGEPYADVDRARAGAVSFLANLLRDRCREVRRGETWTVRVSDDYAVPVCELTFATR